MATVVAAGAVVGPDGRHGPGAIVVDGGNIVEIGPLDATVTEGAASVFDATDDIVAAGLIDVHTHGAGGIETAAGSVDELRRLARVYARHGVTGFLASIGGSDARIRAAVPALVELADEPDPDGARCLGIHLEGPFISPCCPGAFPAATIVAPDADLLRSYLDAAAGHVRMITIAPEVAGAELLLDVALAAGVVVAIGHSAAPYEVAERAIAGGARNVTHLYNAMPSLHHRDPGLIGAALTDDRVTVELIADGIHVDPVVLALTVRCAGRHRVLLVSDSIAAAGLPDGSYRFEEQTVVVADGSARLPDGRLAGSSLTLDRAVSRLAGAAELTWEAALGCATDVPARLLGIDRRRGRVAPGHAADLVGFDAAGGVRWTMVGGRVVYDARG